MLPVLLDSRIGSVVKKRKTEAGEVFIHVPVLRREHRRFVVDFEQGEQRTPSSAYTSILENDPERRTKSCHVYMTFLNSRVGSVVKKRKADPRAVFIHILVLQREHSD